MPLMPVAESGHRRRAVEGSMPARPISPSCPLSIAVLTVSDTRRSRTTVGRHAGGPHDRPGIRSATAPSCRTTSTRSARKVQAWIADPAIDVVITTGGTGFTGRDVTPEALEPLFEKRMDGFSAVFHRISLRQDRHLDDPVAGDRRRRRRDLHLRAAGLARRLQGRLGRHPRGPARLPPPPCNFVEIMPRLDEHLKRGKAQGCKLARRRGRSTRPSARPSISGCSVRKRVVSPRR